MITLFGGPTTNVRKVAIALEELELGHQRHSVSLSLKEQHQDWFLNLAPNNKIPVLVDDGREQTVWESGAILIYLADYFDPEGRILAKCGVERYSAIQGAFFQASAIGPNLGRLNGQLTAAPEDQIPRMIDLFYQEAVRLTEVLDRMLAHGRPYLAGNYSIADIMHYPWLHAARAYAFPAMMEKAAILKWLDRIGERPAVQAGMLAFE